MYTVSSHSSLLWHCLQHQLETSQHFYVPKTGQHKSLPPVTQEPTHAERNMTPNVKQKAFSIYNVQLFCGTDENTHYRHKWLQTDSP